ARGCIPPARAAPPRRLAARTAARRPPAGRCQTAQARGRACGDRASWSPRRWWRRATRDAEAPRAARPRASDSDTCPRAGTLSGVVVTRMRCMLAKLADRNTMARRAARRQGGEGRRGSCRGAEGRSRLAWRQFGGHLASEVGDYLSGDGVECGDFLGGEQVNHVPPDGGDVRLCRLAKGRPPLFCQADERATCVLATWPQPHQTPLLH